MFTDVVFTANGNAYIPTDITIRCARHRKDEVGGELTDEIRRLPATTSPGHLFWRGSECYGDNEMVRRLVRQPELMIEVGKSQTEDIVMQIKSIGIGTGH